MQQHRQVAPAFRQARRPADQVAQGGLGGVEVLALFQQHARQVQARRQGLGEAVPRRLQHGAGGAELAPGQVRPAVEHQPTQRRRAVGRQVRPHVRKGGPVRLGQVEPGQLLPGRHKARLLGHRRPPERLGFGGPALLVEEHAQMVAGLVAAQAGIQAGEVRPGLDRQQHAPGQLGPAVVAVRLQQDPFVEQQLAIIGEARPARPAPGQGVAWLAELLTGLGDEAIQLADDAGGRIGPAQALMQVGEGTPGLVQGVVGPAQVEEGEGFVGLLGFLQVQEAQVTLVLLGAGGRVGVAGVVDAEVGEAHPMTQATDGGQDLFMDAVLPADVGMVAEEAALIDQGGRVAGTDLGGALLQIESRRFLTERREEGAELAAVFRIEVLIGVEPEDPVAGGVAQGFIAGGGEAVAPGEGEDAGTQGGGDFLGAVAGAGIDDDHFGDEVGDGAQAGRQGGLAVFDNEAQGDAVRHGVELLGAVSACEQSVNIAIGLQTWNAPFLFLSIPTHFNLFCYDRASCHTRSEQSVRDIHFFLLDAFLGGVPLILHDGREG